MSEAHDIRQSEALDAYLRDLEAGKKPDQAKLLLEFPDLKELLASVDALEAVAHAAREHSSKVDLLDVEILENQPTITNTFKELAEGRYELHHQIGSGGMGVVWLGTQKINGRQLAIKLLHGSMLGSEEHRRRFENEAKAVASIRHPNIVQLIETGKEQGIQYLVMEYIQGETLAGWVKKEDVPPNHAAEIVNRIALAVQHLHQHGIIHRDLKPGNILLDGTSGSDNLLEYSPKLTDFGLIKWLDQTSLQTRSGAIIGTPSYMAPEQAACAEVTVRTDIYGLGAILYELLTGRPPFQEATPLDTLVQVMESEPVSIKEINRHVPNALVLICMKCLEKNPEERYGMAQEVADDLERFLNDEPIQARPHKLWQKFRRWMRVNPSLSTHWIAALIVTCIIQLNYLIHPIADSIVHWCVQGLLGLWMIFSWICHWYIRHPLWGFLAKSLWSVVDMIWLTSVILVADNHASPLVAGYPAFVAAAGLWFMVPLVWISCITGMLGYLLLVWDGLSRKLMPFAPHHDFIMFCMMIVTAAVVAYQVKRVRALSGHYTRREIHS